MVHSLTSLACFNHIETIVPIVAGLSSQCYQVYADNKQFFAKQITTTNESAISIYAASQNISPKVIYHDQHWLITQFVDGENLVALSQLTLDEKIIIAIKLMAQCHQIVEIPIELAPKTISHELINNTHFSNLQQTELLQIANQLTSLLKRSENLVCCHGDLNFSNILITQTKNAYLVDFECTCTAAAEYDLAMFIAVNNLPKDKITTVVEHYKKHTLVTIDLPLLNHYLLFCYFINGLWYMQANHKKNLAKFTYLAKQQWQNIHSFNLSELCQ